MSKREDARSPSWPRRTRKGGAVETGPRHPVRLHPAPAPRGGGARDRAPVQGNEAPGVLSAAWPHRALDGRSAQFRLPPPARRGSSSHWSGFTQLAPLARNLLPGRGETTVTQGVVVEQMRAVAKLVTSETTVRDVVVYQNRRLGSTKRSLVVVTGKVLSGNRSRCRNPGRHRPARPSGEHRASARPRCSASR